MSSKIGFLLSWFGLVLTLPFIQSCGKTTSITNVQCEYGTSFDTVRNSQIDSGKDASGMGGFVDASGNIFSTGWAERTDNKSHWIVIKSKDQGDTWETVDDQVGDANLSSNVIQGMVDDQGRIYVIGSMSDTNAKGDWLVRRSTNNGKSWDEMDRYRRGTDATSIGIGSKLIQSTELDGTHKFYACGGAYQKDQALGWLVRSSKNGEKNTFDTTEDDFRYTDKKISMCIDIAASSTAVFAVGTGQGAKDAYVGIVRRKKLGTSEWKTVDEFSLSADKKTGVVINALLVNGDTIYWAGTATKSDDSSEWIVRKSSNGGDTWETVDEFQFASKKTSRATSLILAADGTLFASGYGADSADHSKWIIRRSKDAGKTWDTFDQYTLESTKFAAANGTFLDETGNLFAVGTAVDSSDKYHWIIRKLACQTGSTTK